MNCPRARTEWAKLTDCTKDECRLEIMHDEQWGTVHHPSPSPFRHDLSPQDTPPRFRAARACPPRAGVSDTPRTARAPLRETVASHCLRTECLISWTSDGHFRRPTATL